MGSARPTEAGFTAAGTLFTMAFLAIGTGAAVPSVSGHLEQNRVQQAAADIVHLSGALQRYRDRYHELPDSLDQLAILVPMDPWGHRYEYTNFATRGLSDQRYYHSLPLNSQYDLYSRGSDGRTDVSLNAAGAGDDIVRARDGEFVGIASAF